MRNFVSLSRCLIGVCIFLISIFQVGCSTQEEADFRRAEKEEKSEHFRIAVSYYEQVIQRKRNLNLALAAARSAARLTHLELKDYRRAIHFYQQILILSHDQNELKNAQKQIALIYFDNLQDNSNAVKELNKLLNQDDGTEEFNEIRLRLARANYHAGFYQQTLSEIEEVLKKAKDKKIIFNAQILIANIYVSQKLFEKAIQVYKVLLETMSEQSIQENVVVNMAVCYEELLKFNDAVEVLKKYKDQHKQPEYIELRIKRILERQKNAPGAKGFRK